MATISQIAFDLRSKIGLDESKYQAMLKERWHQGLGKSFFDSIIEFTRDNKNISEKSIAERLGVADTTLNRWIKNETIPRGEKTFAIATLVARCNLNEVRLPTRNDTVWFAVRLCLRTIRIKDLTIEDVGFPSKDDVVCLRNLAWNSRFNIFNEFEKPNRAVINGVIKQVLDSQKAVFANSSIHNGRHVIQAWQNWGDSFALLLGTLNAESFGAVKDA